MKLFGFIPYYREKDIEAAGKYHSEAKASYDFARQSSTVLDFLAFWTLLQEKCQCLHEYEDRIPPATYVDYIAIESVLAEFQWRLRDTIERSSLSAISDLKGDYRNNKGPRLDAFLEDLDYADGVSDADTIQFTIDSIHSVFNSIGVKLPANSDSQFTNGCKSAHQDEYALYGGVDAALLSIDLMEGHAFEQWCAEALRNFGFVDVEVTPGSGDQGVDVLARKDGIKYAVQCKCYSSNLGNTPIQEVNAGKFFYRCHVGVVMTNQYFTPKARELAEATGTLLWDRDWIKTYLDTYPAGANSTAQAAPVDHISAQNSSDGEAIMDEMFPACVDVILETEQASVAMIQRRLKLQYVRAAQLMDLMEKFGIVGPYQGSRPRNILITKEQWSEMRPHIQNLK